MTPRSTHRLTAWTSDRRVAVAAVTAAAFLGFGCNVLSLPYFLAVGADDMQPPSCMKLTPPEGAPKGREVRVVVFASTETETRPEFLRIDREVADHLCRRLREYYKEKKEHVYLVPVARVEKFKDEHPDWRSWEQAEIGKHFDADYVVDLQIKAVSLYEKGSLNSMYHGRLEILVGLLPMHKAEDGRIDKDFVCEYPTSLGSISNDDVPVTKFKEDFLDYASRRLSWYFIPHPAEDQMSMDHTSQ